MLDCIQFQRMQTGVWAGEIDGFGKSQCAEHAVAQSSINLWKMIVCCRRIKTLTSVKLNGWVMEMRRRVSVQRLKARSFCIERNVIGRLNVFEPDHRRISCHRVGLSDVLRNLIVPGQFLVRFV